MKNDDLKIVVIIKKSSHGFEAKAFEFNIILRMWTIGKLSVGVGAAIVHEPEL